MITHRVMSARKPRQIMSIGMKAHINEYLKPVAKRYRRIVAERRLSVSAYLRTYETHTLKEAVSARTSSAASVSVPI